VLEDLVVAGLVDVSRAVVARVHVQFRALAPALGAPGLDGVEQVAREPVAAEGRTHVEVGDVECVAAREHRR